MPDNHLLTTIYANWKGYQEKVAAAIAPLTAAQLTLRAAPHLHSIGEIAEHMVGVRIGWMVYSMGEDVATIRDLSHFGVDPRPTSTAAELVNDLGVTWRLISNALARWSDADLKQTFIETDDDGNQYPLERAWVIYHLLEHDLHHGGEVSLTLGAHGLEAPDI